MRRIWLLNLALAAALAVAGARLWSSLRAPLPALPRHGAAPAPAAAEAESKAPGGEARAGDYDLIVGKDLFSQARGAAPPPPKAAPEVVQPPKPPAKVTLYGVVIVDGEKSAYLQEGTQDTKPRRVREGEAFGGGKVTAIRPDGVTLQLPGGEIAVPLRTPKEVAGSVPPVIQPPVPVQGMPPGAVRGPPQPAARGAVPGIPAVQPGRPGQVIPPSPRYTPAPPVEDFTEDEGFQEDLEGEEESIEEGDLSDLPEEDAQEAE